MPDKRGILHEVGDHLFPPVLKYHLKTGTFSSAAEQSLLLRNSPSPTFSFSLPPLSRKKNRHSTRSIRMEWPQIDNNKRQPLFFGPIIIKIFFLLLLFSSSAVQTEIVLSEKYWQSGVVYHVLLSLSKNKKFEEILNFRFDWEVVTIKWQTAFLQSQISPELQFLQNRSPNWVVSLG
jgi:hypothetical protein